MKKKTLNITSTRSFNDKHQGVSEKNFHKSKITQFHRDTINNIFKQPQMGIPLVTSTVHRTTTSLDLLKFLVKWDETLSQEVLIKVGNSYHPIKGLQIRHPANNPIIEV
jgi:hypothetical protein